MNNKKLKLKEEIHKIMHSFSLEFKPRDAVQIMIGATILAIPVAFTEETWKLGENLPINNVLIVLAMSVIFIGIFVYYNYYRTHGLKTHWKEFTKRAVSTYFLSFIIVAVLLTLIQKAPWSADLAIAFKRTVIVSLPASMSAAVADVIK